MSFRARLRLFFVLLVIVPMIALGVVLFALVSRSQTGKADAGMATGSRVAFGAHHAAAVRAEPVLRSVAADPRLRAALAAGTGVEQRLRQLMRDGTEIVSIELRSPEGELVARAGSAAAVASRAAPLAVSGQTVGTLAVSVTEASDFAARVRELTGLHVGVFRRGRLLAATTGRLRGRGQVGGVGAPRDLELSGERYRGRIDTIREPAGPPVELAVFRPASELSSSISRDRLLIAGLLAAFLALALVSAVVVSRSLTGQIATFLSAARRLARGDFAHAIPVQGNDEFADFGREFNSMSSQLEAKIEEVERKRRELEQTIRRVGDALATGLDRDGVVALAVRTAVDACAAQVGRALPLDSAAFGEFRSGPIAEQLRLAIEAAERRAFEVRADAGAELLEPVDSEDPARRPRLAAPGSVGLAHALAVPLRAVLGSPSAQYLGVLSIARRGRAFSRDEEDLLEYLAGQAVVSIENASLHELVERQAVTDELTGLANLRAFHAILEREIERSVRFEAPVALLMVDLDHFKRINDEHGHQQGDEVLASMAAVLRDFSRDIDAPARYGGEEFAVVLPQTDSDGAALLAERMREAIEKLQVARLGGRGWLAVTASFGVASLPKNASDRASLIAAADAALYRAKRGGRNRVERADPVPATR